MTPTLAGRLQTRISLAITVGVLWTIVVATALPRPARISMSTAYLMMLESLGLMTLTGLLWELIYHGLQQARWDKDWPSIFALMTVVNEAVPLWFLVHAVHVMPGTTGFSSPLLSLFAIHIGSTWLIIWLFIQGPMRVINVRWRFEGGRIMHRTLSSSWWPHDRTADLPIRTGEHSKLAGGAASRTLASRPGESRAQADNSAPIDEKKTSAELGNLIEGVACRHGHFNHPGIRYCMVCGSSLLASIDGYMLGKRLPLGILVLSDGVTHVLDRDLAAIMPGASSALDFVCLDDHSAGPYTAEIRLVRWHSVVSSAVQAISVVLPSGREFRLEPNTPLPLIPGTVFVIGGHRVLYESPFQPDSL
jgi:hypothetical protein